MGVTGWGRVTCVQTLQGGALGGALVHRSAAQEFCCLAHPWPAPGLFSVYLVGGSGLALELCVDGKAAVALVAAAQGPEPRCVTRNRMESLHVTNVLAGPVNSVELLSDCSLSPPSYPYFPPSNLSSIYT